VSIDLAERRRRNDSKLTDRQLRVLHRVHMERGISIRELGRMVGDQAGYASAAAAARAISRGFARLHLPARTSFASRLATMVRGYDRCEEVKATGERCESFAMAGSDLCWHHRFPEQARAQALAVSPFARAA
jgi:hypothetical protein